MEAKRPKLQEMSDSEFDEVYSDTVSSDYRTSPDLALIRQGAEARVYQCTYLGRPALVKERFPKKYRTPELDAHLTKERQKAEIRSLAKSRQIGIEVPTLFFVDGKRNRIVMERIENAVTLKQHFQETQAEFKDDFEEKLAPSAKELGRVVANLHKNDLIHGDLTTSNVLIRRETQEIRLVLIDFGLSFSSRLVEDKGVDLFVLEKAMLSTHPNSEGIFQRFLDSYCENWKKGSPKIISKLDDVRARGRKREMVG